jgi:hypothetical protein
VLIILRDTGLRADKDDEVDGGTGELDDDDEDDDVDERVTVPSC